MVSDAKNISQVIYSLDILSCIINSGFCIDCECSLFSAELSPSFSHSLPLCITHIIRIGKMSSANYSKILIFPFTKAQHYKSVLFTSMELVGVLSSSILPFHFTFAFKRNKNRGISMCNTNRTSKQTFILFYGIWRCPND